MSSYFDGKSSLVRGLGVCSDETFLCELETLEDRVAADVSRITGDREFPAELREKLQGVIACKTVRPAGGVPNPRARDMAVLGRMSEMIEDLHTAFHVVASRRIETRFGLLTDDPVGDAHRRDAHDRGES